MILVTGATGFLGSRIACRLAARRGDAVRALVRDPGRLPPDVQTEVVVGDMTDRETLRRAVSGCDRIVHAAALVREWAPDRRLFDRVNVEAPLALLDLATEARRVLVVSSFLALGPSDDRPAGEDHAVPRRRFFNDYERTKTVADARLRDRIEGGDDRLVVVYPGVLHGPGPRTAGNLVARLILDHARGRIPGLVGDGEQVWSYVHVEDAVDGVLAALEGPGGARWVLGGENVSQRAFWETAARLTGRAPPARRIPRPLATLVARAAFLRDRIAGREPRMTPGAIRIFDHDWALDSSRARAALGYAPRPLAEGLRDTIDWLRREGELAS